MLLVALGRSCEKSNKAGRERIGIRQLALPNCEGGPPQGDMEPSIIDYRLRTLLCY